MGTGALGRVSSGVLETPGGMPLTDPSQFYILPSGLAAGTECNSINEKAQVHHAARRRGARVAVCSVRAAGGNAGNRLSPQRVARAVFTHDSGVPARSCRG